MSPSLLSQVRQHISVDVDSMDIDVTLRHTNASEQFCDMTSNQAIAYFEGTKPKNVSLVKAAIQAANTQFTSAADVDFGQLAVDHLTVLLAKEIYPHIKGNVLVQTSPSVAGDTEKTITHAKRLVSIFETNGIPKNRVCIKIPTTPESVVACQHLSALGIQTLATALFSLPQALAASQAGCTYIAPYFQELRVHFGLSPPNVAPDHHPMYRVIQSICQKYQDIGSKTLVMPASVTSAEEVIALTKLQPHHITISPVVLDQLSNLPPIAGGFPHGPQPSQGTTDQTDYILDGAAKLKESLASDMETTRKLTEALEIFGDFEEKLKVYSII
ncbi:aldolase [Infundibulicybe gibba]|nr:aldolase [Infundibulicybe gibba]